MKYDSNERYMIIFQYEIQLLFQEGRTLSQLEGPASSAPAVNRGGGASRPSGKEAQEPPPEPGPPARPAPLPQRLIVVPDPPQATPPQQHPARYRYIDVTCVMFNF